MNLVKSYTQKIEGAWRGLFSAKAEGKQQVLTGKQRSLIVDLIKRTNYLTQKDIKKWRDAWQAAIDADYPWRYDLLMIYQDVMIDSHLSGAISNRKNKVLGTPFHIVGPDGDPDPELTKLLEKPWFRGVDVGDGISGGYMSLTLDSIFNGHSLMELRKGGKSSAQKEAWEIDQIELVPREHVLPEYGLVVREKHEAFNKIGAPYRMPPYDAWVVEAGKPTALGLLLKAAPQAISKKNVTIFWDEFAEIFGMPIRIGNTSTINADDRARMEEMLANMGSAAWGLFDESTEIKIVESNRGDAYRVYDQRIERANSEMSKLILGQTMSMDDGSSRSQAEVHLEVLEDLHKSDLVFLQDQINTTLMPVLCRHGYPFEQAQFQWDISEDITEEDRANDQFILDNFETGDDFVEYIRKKYRVPIVGMKQAAPAPAPIPPVADPKKKRLEPVGFATGQQLEALYSCNHDHTHDFTAKWDQLDPMIQRVIRAVFDGDLPEGQLPTELYQEIAKILYNGVEGEWIGADSIDWDSPDNVKLNFIRGNVHSFSAAKSATELREMNLLLFDSDGNQRPWREFRDLAREVHEIHNVNYLEAEFLNAQAGGQMASQWLRYQEGKEDLPNLIYQTVGDDRVRQTHRGLDGITLPIDDPFWDTYYPPNGWRCRCDVIQTDTDTDDPTESMNRARGQEVKPYFQRNVGKTGRIYGAEHPYFQEAATLSEMTATGTYALPSLEDIDRAGLPSRPEGEEVERIVTDPRGILIKAPNKLAADVVEQANEVFSNGEGDLTYIRHYKEGSEKAVSAQTEVESNSPAAEADRAGILEYNNG